MGKVPKEVIVRSTSFAQWPELTADWHDVGRVTIDMLPDHVLLEIFGFYVDEKKRGMWRTLVHVCQKWRSIAFGSPGHLNMRLFCNAETPVEVLDVWPPLPIVIWEEGYEYYDVDNIIAILEHNDRVCQLGLLDIPNSEMERVLGVMQQPFPALRILALQLWHSDKSAPVVPTSFLGGSAPQLRLLTLNSIPFPGLPNFLLSAPHLAYLNLTRIPHSGYISPEAMVACLSVLTRLETLIIDFESSESRPEQNQPPPPQTRTLLPALTQLQFSGAGEYAEDLVARIDAPLLDKLKINFFQQLIFPAPQLTRFIRRIPKFKARAEAPGSLFRLDSFGVLSVTLP